MRWSHWQPFFLRWRSIFTSALRNDTEENVHGARGLLLAYKAALAGNTAPDTFACVAQWLSFGEYLYRHFLGRSVCSLSMASGTGMLQTRARAWNTELVDVLAVRPEQLPPLGDLHESVQGLTPAYASAWPTLCNVPWFPAIGDGKDERRMFTLTLYMFRLFRSAKVEILSLLTCGGLL